MIASAKAIAYGHQADALATLARVAHGCEVQCGQCGRGTYIEDATPYELPPDEDGERIGLACTACVGKDRDERTDDDRECPECGDVARRRWCYAHERRVPRVPARVVAEVDAVLGGVRRAA